MSDNDRFKKEFESWAGKEPEHPLIEGMRQAPDGKWYIPDPNRPGKYLEVEEKPKEK